MIDKEIIDYVKSRQDETKNSFELMFKSFTQVILSDNQNIKDKINDVKEDIKEVKNKVENQNSSIHTLKEWREGHQSIHNTKEKGFVKTLKIAGFIVTIVAVSATIFFGSRKMKSIEKDMTFINDSLVSPIVRGGYTHYELIKDTLK